VGLEFQTTGALRNTIDNVGKKFELRTAPLPLLDPKNGHLPTGGNAVVILSKDPAKLDAAWRFAKFAAGPYGASVVVPGTGYVPNNALAATSPQYLGDFYATHPLYRAGLDQMDRMIPWYSFPGSPRPSSTTCRAWSRARRRLTPRCTTRRSRFRSCFRGTEEWRDRPAGIGAFVTRSSRRRHSLKRSHRRPVTCTMRRPVGEDRACTTSRRSPPTMTAP